MVDSKENDKLDLGVKGLRDRVTIYHTIYYPSFFFLSSKVLSLNCQVVSVIFL